jgi:hypothetical protein
LTLNAQSVSPNDTTENRKDDGSEDMDGVFRMELLWNIETGSVDAPPNADYERTEMGIWASVVRFAVLSALGALLTPGCSGNGNGGSASSAEALDPTQMHYGFSDDVWGTKWWQWIYQTPQTNGCNIPFLDPDGSHCTDGQSGDVFFLAGTQGGKIERDKCAVPSGKAIFFPIINPTADNEGVPTAMQLTPSGLMGYVQTQMEGVAVSSLSAEFDGVAITDLGRFKTQIMQYTYTLPPEPNIYTCEGDKGLTGTVSPAFEAGYYIMLAPPAPGAHVLHFAGSSPMTTPPVMVDVTYKFTIQ